jgi:hypothetical protein
MKKLLIILALGVFASCGNGTSTNDTRDSALNAVDSAQTEQKDAVDSAASAQKNNIDSVKQQENAAIDSAAEAKKDSIKK